MMNNIPLTASPVSAPWIPWVLLVLLALLVVDLVLDKSVISGVRKLFSMPERSYLDNSNRFSVSIVSSLFRTGTFALAVYVSCWQGQSMSPVTYLMLIGVVYAVIVIRQLVIGLLYVIFRFAPQREVVYRHYLKFATLTALLMYLSLLVLTNRWSEAIPYVTAVLVGLFLICVLQMMLRVYTTKAMSPVYVMLSFVYLEILPIGLLLAGSIRLIEH